jgi:hypothetical protein
MTVCFDQPGLPADIAEIGPLSDTTLFAFESDFAGTLRCIPMIVRLKLDLCGIKLSLRQWSHFTRDDRAALVENPCETAAEAAAYGVALAALIADRVGETAVNLPIDPAPTWADTSCVPERVATYVAGLGLAALTAGQWGRLSVLQRFALFKLTRPGHDNDNLVPAMQEFGLLG